MTEAAKAVMSFHDFHRGPVKRDLCHGTAKFLCYRLQHIERMPSPDVTLEVAN